MKHAISLILALALASCGGGSPPLPTPTPAPRPGNLVLSASWTAPMGVSLKCGGEGLSDPFGCQLAPSALWGVPPALGNWGYDCVDPEPNVCFQPSGGVLGYSFVNSAIGLVSASTVPKGGTTSIETVITATYDCSQVAYAGPVIYDGEGAAGDPDGNYRALYLSCPGDGGDVHLWLYSPTKAAALGPWTFAQGSAHDLRIDFVPGVSFTYFIDGSVVFTETPFSFSGDAMTFTQDPHPALWFGSSVGKVGRFDVYAGP